MSADNPIILAIFALQVIIFILCGLIFLKLYGKHKNFSFSRFLGKRANNGFGVAAYESFVGQLAYALSWLSQHNIGALIVVEKNDNLKSFIYSGYEMKARVNAEFIVSVFSNKRSALHDGGLIIRKFDIVAVSSYFPVTQANMIFHLGARHRAAIGITEKNDCVAFVVSETTGKTSFCLGGKIFDLKETDIGSLSAKVFEILNFYID